MLAMDGKCCRTMFTLNGERYLICCFGIDHLNLSKVVGAAQETKRGALVLVAITIRIIIEDIASCC